MAKSVTEALLSSGIPLEFEVSNIFLKHGFHIEGEFPYTRHDSEQKDFSVDLYAHEYLLNENEEILGEVYFLVECKYRNPSKLWLFMPDNNVGDFSPAAWDFVRQIPEYTTFQYDHKYIENISGMIHSVLKGVEIQKGEKSSSEASDADIRHAVNQLRYALPEIIGKAIIENGMKHPNDCKPAFVVPLLVTNAPLGLLKEELTIEMVRDSENLDGLYEPTEWVDMFSPHTKNFNVHCQSVFDEYANLYLHSPSRMNTFVYIFEELFKDNTVAPIHISQAIRTLPYKKYYSQFPVVTLSDLPKFLEILNKTLTTALKKGKQTVFSREKEIT